MESKRKSIMDMTLQELQTRQLEHRVQDHHTADLDVFFDCALCGAIEARMRYLTRGGSKDAQIQS